MEIPIKQSTARVKDKFKAKVEAKESPDQSAEEFHLNRKDAIKKGDAERQKHLKEESVYKDQIDYAKATGPLSDPDKEGYISFAKGSGKLSPKEDDKYGYIEFARGAGKKSEKDDDKEGYIEFAKGAGEIKTQKENEKTKPETLPVKPENTLEDLKADLDAKRLAFARMDNDISGRWKKLKKILGFSREETKDPGVEEKKKEYKDALRRYFEARKQDLGSLDKAKAAELYKEFAVDEALNLMQLKADERVKERKDKGEWPEKVVDGYMKMVDKWRNLSYKKKIVFSGLILGSGLISGAYLGGIFVGLSTTMGLVQRAVSGGATGLGMKKIMDTRSKRKMEKKSGKELEKILSQDDWAANLLSKLDGAVENIDSQLSMLENKDLTRKRVATYSGIFVGSGVMSQIIQSSGFGSFAKEKLFGHEAGHTSGRTFFEESRNIKPLAGSDLDDQVAGVRAKDTNIKSAVWGGNEGNISKNIPVDQDASTGNKNVIKNTQNKPAGPDTTVNKRAGLGQFYEEKTSNARNTKGVSADNLHGRNNSLGEKYTLSKPDVYAKIPETIEAKPDLSISQMNVVDEAAPIPKNIASVEIGKGGNLWKGIENSIKANPKAYGLNPDDPGFTKDMRRMTQTLLNEFAEKKGLTYEQLDQMARAKVRAGDSFKIFYDPASEEIYINDYQGKAFGGKVGSVNSGFHEFKLGKTAGIPEESPGPKTGNTTEYAGQKTGPRVSSMAEIEADYQKDLADRAQARAVRSGQDWELKRERIADLNDRVIFEANMRQTLATRGLLNEVIRKAGIGSNASVWDGSAEKWFRDLLNAPKLTSQDVLHNDSIEDINKNREILKNIIRYLPKPGPGETTNDVLMRALYVNPENLVKINQALGKK